MSEPCPLAGDYISEYESQGAVPNTRHQEKEDVMGLAQNEEMKVEGVQHLCRGGGGRGM